MTEVDYYVEIHPGPELATKIQTTKDAVIARLGDRVDDGNLAKSITDTPHITLHVGRTHDKEGLLKALREIAENWKPINYQVECAQQQKKYGFIEVNSKIEDESEFKALHLAIVEASLPYLSGINAMFKEEDFQGQFSVNRDCGFPPARDFYHPHASIGRLHLDLLPEVADVLAEFNPVGSYTTGGLTVWEYTGDSTFSTHKPIYIPIGK